jgi:6-phosphogluconolactonase
MKTRREFAKQTALLATGGLGAFGASKKNSGPVRLYVGTYSKGIYLFEMDPRSGGLSQRALFEDSSNPAWLDLGPQRHHLFAANETSTFRNAPGGSVSSFSVDPADGHLTLLARANSGGMGPAHLSVHPSGKYLLTANYAGGRVAVLPIGSGGEIKEPSQIILDKGELGPTKPASAPPGNNAVSGHDAPHAHMIQADASGKFVLSADLGLDELLIWRFDVATGILTPNDPPAFKLPAGDGPRHFVFHPNGKWLFVLQEEGSTLVTCDWDGVAGTLRARSTVSTLPKGFVGTNFTSEIRLSPDAKFVYAANRLHDTIAWFSIAADGSLTLRGEEWTRGDYPRSFTIDPTGSFLFSCNQHSDAVTCFRRNTHTGALTFTEQYTPVGAPAVIVFL